MMKLFKEALVVLVVIIGGIYISGCETTSSLSGTAVILGTVRDSSSLAMPIKGATITTSPATYEVITDSLGNFMITGVTGGDYTITVTKPYYFTKVFSGVTAVDGDTVKPQIKILFTQIYTTLDSLEEYFNDFSYSAMDLLNLKVIQENQNTIKDIQMRDSAGTSANFYIRSGDLALKLAGLETRFMGPLTKAGGDSIFTESEFLNLNKIKPSGTISPSDFYIDRTGYFSPPGNVKGGLKKVYAFWLKTRSNPSLNYYGMIYLNDAYYTPANKYFLKVNVKVNLNGVDLFGPNQ